jgi:hypothetical protein
MREDETEDVRTSASTRYDEKESFEERWNEKYFRATHDRVEILEWEKQQELEKAKNLKARQLEIEKYYNGEIAKDRQQMA